MGACFLSPTVPALAGFLHTMIIHALFNFRNSVYNMTSHLSRGVTIERFYKLGVCIAIIDLSHYNHGVREGILMQFILNLFRGVMGAGALVLAILSAYILFSGISLGGADDFILFFSLLLFFAVVGLSAFFFKKISLKGWAKTICCALLGMGSLWFLAFFIQKDFQFKYMVTGLYMVFLTVSYAWSMTGRVKSQESQTVFMAAFIGMTLLVISFGIIGNLASGLLVCITSLFLLVYVVYPRLTRGKMALLFQGEHQKLRKKLVTRLLPQDMVLLAYSQLFTGEFLDLEGTLDLLEQKSKEKSAMALYLSYVKADIEIQKGFFTQSHEGLRETFDHMLALNQKMFKKPYPMATAYAMMYWMGLYEDQAAFLKATESAHAYEQKYDFKKQPDAFHGFLAFSNDLFDATMAYQRGEGQEVLNKVLEKSIQPVYKNHFKGSVPLTRL